MAGQYIRYTPLGGSGSGTITSINGATGPAINILPGTGISVSTVGNNITINNTGSTPTGTANTFAGFDNSGDLESVPGFTINANGGMDESITQSPNNGGFNNQNNFTVNFTPLQNSPNEGWSIQGIQANLDTGSSGFSQGTNGTAAQLLGLGFIHHGTGDVGGLNALIFNADIGNGTDPISVKGMGMSFGFGTVNANVTLDGSLQGYTFQPAVNAAALGTSNFSISAFEDFSNIGIPVHGYNGFSSGPTLANITNNNNYNGVALSPTIAAFTGNAGFVGVGIFPQITTMSATGNFNGVNISPTVATSHGSINGVVVNPTVNAGDANFTGIQVSGNGTATLPSVRGLSIQLQGIDTSDVNGPVAIESDARLNINALTEPTNAQTIQIGSRVEHLFHILPGSPLTGTDLLGLDLAGDLEAEDSMAVGPIGIGFSSVGFIADMAVAVGKTIDQINVFLPAVALPDPGFTTGGTVSTMEFVHIMAPLSQGGSITTTNLYGVRIMSDFSTTTSPTNKWGISVEDPALSNHIAGNIDSASHTLNGSTSGALTLLPAAVTTSHSLTFPAAQGAASTVLTNNGSGVLSWASVSSAPGGSNKQVQYNDSGVFNGAANFEYDKVNTNLRMGGGTSVTGTNASAFGNTTTATGNNSHAEGFNTTASAGQAHAEGNGTVASAANTHAEGLGCQAVLTNAHAEGNSTIAAGAASHSAGLGTQSNGDNQTAVGQYNVIVGTPGSPVSTDEVFSVGIGTGTGSRATGFSVRRDGLIDAHSHLISNVLDPVSAQDAATKAFVLANAGVVTAWQAYTPTFTNTGATSNVDFIWRQVGPDSIDIQGRVSFAAVVNAGTAQVSIPSGLTVDATLVANQRTFGDLKIEAAVSTPFLPAAVGGNTYFTLYSQLGNSDTNGTNSGNTTWCFHISGLPVSGL